MDAYWRSKDAAGLYLDGIEDPASRYNSNLHGCNREYASVRVAEAQFEAAAAPTEDVAAQVLLPRLLTEYKRRFMATIQNSYVPEYFRVIHPLDDVQEQKCSSAGLGHIAMTPAVRISLTVLRIYLIVMTLMLGYHVLDLAGILHSIR
jgi:hypothetical protein